MEQTQALWSELKLSAFESADAGLRQRIADSLPARQSVHRTTLMEAFRMRKRLVVAGVLLVLVVATGLVASQLLPAKGYGSGQVDGRDWSYASTFQGRVTCLDAKGDFSRDVGIVTLQGDPSQGEVELTVDGAEYAFRGVGKHEVRDSSGRLLGYVNMAAAPSEQELAAESEKTLARITGTETGVEGFDKVLGISWEMLGTGEVTVSVPPSVKAGMCGGSASSYRNVDVKVPELVVKTPGGVIEKKGYGVYEIPVDITRTGREADKIPTVGPKPVLTLTIEPGNPPTK